MSAALLTRQVRLGSGLVLAAYVFTHLLNHTLGLLSLDLMEAGRRLMLLLWGNPLSQVLLYAALLTHIALALWAVYRRDHLRMRRWKAIQWLLGFAIPPLLFAHIVGTRGAVVLLDAKVDYPWVVAALWSNPWLGIRQTLALLVVWLHLLVGLHFWLRIKSWYVHWLPLLYPLAILLPLLALLGFVRAGLEIGERMAQPDWVHPSAAAQAGADPAQIELVASLAQQLLSLLLVLLGFTLAARLLRNWLRHRRGVFQLELPSGKIVSAPIGATMLEAIHGAGLPHASVCGGRGRCTTCRVRIGSDRTTLPAPKDIEQQALARISAPANVRLACQARPQGGALKIMPLLPAGADANTANRRGGVGGREMQAAFVFVDMRGSTALGERLLPYDVVFVLNQFFEEMVAALDVSGGHYAQFNGDGLMAIYGLETDLATSCRQALHGALAMLRGLERLNHNLLPELGEPLRIGIGIHSGEAIVGSMGPPTAPIVSALGDNVNIAARLETLSKELDCPLVVSAYTAEQASVDFSGFSHREVAVRGRTEPIPVYLIADTDALQVRLEDDVTPIYAN